MANDYRIEVASDQQGVYLPFLQASGNVKDNSNQRVVVFDYGLPTANQIEWNPGIVEKTFKPNTSHESNGTLREFRNDCLL